MIKQVFKIDINGYYLDDVILQENEPTPSDCVEIQPPHGIKNARWNGTAWEGILPVALDIAKAGKIEDLKYRCQHTIYAGFVSTVLSASGVAYEFGFSQLDQMNFNGQLNKINLWNNQLTKGQITQADYDAKFPLNWKAKNVGVVQLTEAQFIKILDDAEKHQLTQQQKYWNLESQVKAAATEADVNLINW